MIEYIIVEKLRASFLSRSFFMLEGYSFLFGDLLKENGYPQMASMSDSPNNRRINAESPSCGS
ncbi:hypothetical protein KMA67_11350 [Enterococcus durans]|uniref:hypothetical protein n=1 Tax=Enterococcus durans TaxID=53345 RepID=UPI0012FD14FD|nr:hypothetical protein [Enterococcus durans]MCB8506299.1 hypothetical protein [Enterococcus durans]